MKKRGQFYLVGAFIIVMIITGLVYVYSSARAPEGESNVVDLADEAYYETKQLIENRLISGSTEAEIVKNVSDVVKYYGKKHAYIDIAVIYGNKDLAYIINDTAINSATPTGEELVVTLRGSSRTFKMQIGKKIFVMVVGEKNGEKSVVVK